MSSNLLEFIAQQQLVKLKALVAQQQARIVALEAEITRLNKICPKPNIKPNTKLANVIEYVPCWPPCVNAGFFE